MNIWIQTIVSIIVAVLASSGLWAFLLKKSDKKDAQSEMLMGLAHDRILYLGKSYLERSPTYITMDEYDNLKNYLYEPYKKLGGNGTAERVMDEIDKLPITPNDHGKE
ncbi:MULTISPECIES: hypothetical protein [unclassified Coprococcus]|uniref:hypothetical protein n=1 Tax=unclassified Coprococcus TaxID=2684943 RepID=UPI000E4849C3|nr:MULTISPECIES: hypothetical protein [unclassified Coprococcus]RGI33555.1 hypothetical protein DXB91_12460 [Coprococcus sp. OM06-34AC]RGI40943.1 hypothetical protein DXB88_10690 [Coprococcus sp. OM06-25]